MANKKISQTPSTSTLGSSDLFVVVQGGITKNITSQNVLDTSVTPLIDNTFGEGNVTLSSLSNGFVQDATNPLKVIIAGYNNHAVYFRGKLDCSLVTFTPGSFVQAFRLPSNARPKVISHFPVIGEIDALGICAVHPDGYVYFKNLVSDLTITGVIDLANVNYYIDPF